MRKLPMTLPRLPTAAIKNLSARTVIPQRTADESRAQMPEANATWHQYVAVEQYEWVLAPYDGIVTACDLHRGALVAIATANTTTPAIHQLADT